jgi:AAA15 family ATPase/GTPase
MYVLKINVSGLPLFERDVEFDFLTRQRVSADAKESLYHLFSNHYQNNVLSIIGINASGKTTLLKVLIFSLRLLNNDPINTIEYDEIFDGLEEAKNVVFDIFFYSSDSQVNKLHTVIRKQEGRLIIIEESLYSKSAKSVKSKKTLLDFDGIQPRIIRDTQQEFLLEDVSIMVAVNKRAGRRIAIKDMLRFTNNNLLQLKGDTPPQLIAFFDPSIEYLHYDSKQSDAPICLKFREKEAIYLRELSDLNRYLSSGTIKGINVFMQSMELFQKGGCLIIDEMENHFNKEIIKTLIRFFMDAKINVGGAVLIFSTHYAELLDEFSANDNIYITRNKTGIEVENLSSELKRNDIKKSDVYQSGFLGGTTPRYEAYAQLRNILLKPQIGD